MKHSVKINETRLREIISESIKRVIKESVDYVERVKSLIDAANNAYQDAVNYCEDTYALMDKEGDSYGLADLISLKNGRVIISYDDIYNKHIDMNVKVLVKKNGKITLFNGDYYDEGWKDVRKVLNQIIQDAERGKHHMQSYDPNWEVSDSPEGFETNKLNMKKFNKSIGLTPNTGIDNIRKNY